MPEVIWYPLKGPGELSGTSLDTNQSCGQCHPPNGIRQLWNMTRGTRSGPQAWLMTPAIETLTVADMTDIVAYLASTRCAGASATRTRSAGCASERSPAVHGSA